MLFEKINNYTNSNDKIEYVQLTLDKSFKGRMSLSLTNMDNTTVPAIATGSWSENNGSLYESTSETSISTTDPNTTSPVADGDIYIVLYTVAGVISPAFTALTPTWSDTKQGWYGTSGNLANSRFVGAVTKSGASYTEKRVIIGTSNDLDGRLFDPDEV
jgi:hypothetical protein